MSLLEQHQQRIDDLRSEISELEDRLADRRRQLDEVRAIRDRLLARQTPNSRQKRRTVEAEWGLPMRRVLEELAAGGFTQTEAAGALGYHPDYVARLRKRYGVTFRDGRGGMQWRDPAACAHHLDKIRPQRNRHEQPSRPPSGR